MYKIKFTTIGSFISFRFVSQNTVSLVQHVWRYRFEGMYWRVVRE